MTFPVAGVADVKKDAMLEGYAFGHKGILDVPCDGQGTAKRLAGNVPHGFREMPISPHIFAFAPIVPPSGVWGNNAPPSPVPLASQHRPQRKKHGEERLPGPVLPESLFNFAGKG